MTPRLSNLARLLITLLAALLGVGATARPGNAQTTITLRAAVTMTDPGAAVTLGDVADVSGDDSARWRAVLVAEAGKPRESISIADVRKALEGAKANWGLITLRGSSCRIDGLRPPQPAATERSVRVREQPNYAVIDVTGPLTVGKAVAKRLAAHYGVGPSEIQLAFDAADAATMNTAVPDRHVIEVKPAASSSSSRVPVRASVYAGDQVLADHRMTVDVLLLRDALVAGRTIERREAIAAADVRSEKRWLSPGATRSTLAEPERVVGSLARGRIKEGDTIAAADIEAPIVIKRGEIVYVHCLSGSIVVQAKARAQEQGREGEIITFRMEGSDESFAARIAGPGRAVMVADAPPARGRD